MRFKVQGLWEMEFGGKGCSGLCFWGRGSGFKGVHEGSGTAQQNFYSSSSLKTCSAAGHPFEKGLGFETFRVTLRLGPRAYGFSV